LSFYLRIEPVLIDPRKYEQGINLPILSLQLVPPS